MAKVDPDKDGKYKLGGSRDTDLEGIDSKKYDVFTDTEKLAEAQDKFKDVNWFVSYTITHKDGTKVDEMPEYKIKFNKPKEDDNSFELYYYLGGDRYSLNHQSENSKRAVAKLNLGDPPVGGVP
jgi:hypothetical protein